MDPTRKLHKKKKSQIQSTSCSASSLLSSRSLVGGGPLRTLFIDQHNCNHVLFFLDSIEYLSSSCFVVLCVVESRAELQNYSSSISSSSSKCEVLSTEFFLLLLLLFFRVTIGAKAPMRMESSQARNDGESDDLREKLKLQICVLCVLFARRREMYISFVWFHFGLEIVLYSFSSYSQWGEVQSSTQQQHTSFAQENYSNHTLAWRKKKKTENQQHCEPSYYTTPPYDSR